MDTKQSFRKYRKIEIISWVLSDNSRTKLELKRNCRNILIPWRLNSTLLNDEWVIEEIRKKLKIKRKVENRKHNM